MNSLYRKIEMVNDSKNETNTCNTQDINNFSSLMKISNFEVEESILMYFSKFED